MPLIAVNYWAIIVCGIINMALGYVWYGPLFGKQWAKMMGFDLNDKHKAKEMQKKAVPAYAVMFVCSLVMAYILLRFAGYATAKTATEGAATGFWLWLGFVVPPTLSTSMFGGKNLKLWFIEVGYYLVSMLIFGAILTAWV